MTRLNTVIFAVVAVSVATAAFFISVLSPLTFFLFLAIIVGVALLFMGTNALMRCCIPLVLILVTGVPFLRLDGAADAIRVPLILAIAGIIGVMQWRSKAKPPKPVLISFAVFFGSLAVSTALTADPNEWNQFLISLFFTLVGIVVMTSCSELGMLPYLWKSLIYVAIAHSVYAIWEVGQLPDPLWRGARILPDGESVRLMSDLVPGLARAQTTFGHPLPLAFFLAIAAIVLICSIKMRWGAKLLLWFLLSVGVVATGSRNAVLLFILTSALAYSRRAFYSRAPLVVLAITGGALAMWPILTAQLDRLVNSGSTDHRLAAFDSVKQLLFGRGVVKMFVGDGSASTPRLYANGQLQDDGLQAVDNQFVLTIAQNGVIGILVLLVILVAAFRRADIPLKIVLTAIVIECMIFDILSWPSSTFLAWLFLTLAFISKPKAPRTTQPRIVLSSTG